MPNPFAHEPMMESWDGRRARPVLYELLRPKIHTKLPRPAPRRAAYVCRACRTVYLPKPPEVDDLVCPAKLLQVMKEKVL